MTPNLDLLEVPFSFSILLFEPSRTESIHLDRGFLQRGADMLYRLRHTFAPIPFSVAKLHRLKLTARGPAGDIGMAAYSVFQCDYVVGIWFFPRA